MTKNNRTRQKKKGTNREYQKRHRNNKTIRKITNYDRKRLVIIKQSRK